eukprot:3387235-Amphidinium_carterae.2
MGALCCLKTKPLGTSSPAVHKPSALQSQISQTAMFATTTTTTTRTTKTRTISLRVLRQTSVAAHVNAKDEVILAGLASNVEQFVHTCKLKETCVSAHEQVLKRENASPWLFLGYEITKDAPKL